MSNASLRLARAAMVPALALLLLGVSTTAASAHAGEENTPARELVATAIAILEVHPAPATGRRHDLAKARSRVSVVANSATLKTLKVDAVSGRASA